MNNSPKMSFLIATTGMIVIGCITIMLAVVSVITHFMIMEK